MALFETHARRFRSMTCVRQPPYRSADDRRRPSPAAAAGRPAPAPPPRPRPPARRCCTATFPIRSRSRCPAASASALRWRSRNCGDGAAMAGIVKDAGDDPDVTHGALVIATVRRGPPGSGVTFRRGDGVGTGDAARPADPARRAGDQPGAAPDDRRRPSPRWPARAADFEVEISVPDGEEHRGEDAEPAARHSRRPVDPRHDRHRHSLFLLGLDPLDPSRHRRGARHGLDPCRRRDRQRLRDRGAEAARPARGRS